MSFILSQRDRDILKNRLGLSPVFLKRFESVLEQGDDSAIALSTGALTVTGNETVSGTLAVTGALTGAAAITAGTTVSDANGNVKPFKRYIALLTQSSSSAPVATVLVNELSVVPVWARTSAGLYTATAASMFTSNKTQVELGAQVDLLNKAKAIVTSTSVITVTTSVISVSTGTLIQTVTDGLLTGAIIDIKVFN